MDIYFYQVFSCDPAARPKLLDVDGVGWFSVPFPHGLPIMPSMIAGVHALHTRVWGL